MKIDEVINKILEILKRTLDINLHDTNYYRITDNENDEMDKFKVNLKNGYETDDVTKFLNDCNPTEMKRYLEFNDLIWVDEYINSRERGLFDHDYYYPTEHIKEMNDLLNDNNEKNIFVKKNIFLLGKKGSGKSIAINHWLHSNSEVFLKRKILWLNINLEDLYPLYKKNRGKKKQKDK